MEIAKACVGWREWVALPELGIDKIKAKVDTGAKTCALHAYSIKPYIKNRQDWVEFVMHPLQKDTDTIIICHAQVSDQRIVTDSGGHSEERFVIVSGILMGDKEIQAEITLTNRENMMFRMLLGRNVLNGNFVVDPSESYLLENNPT